MTFWREFPHAPSPGAVLAESAAVSEGMAVPIVIGEKPGRFRAIVSRKDGVARAYVNLCPHFRIPLAMDGRELTVSPGFIWCGFHSAQFRQDDGRCIDGPAKGAGLTPIPVFEADGVIAVADDRDTQALQGEAPSVVERDGSQS